MSLLFFLNAPATTELYTLSLHDALPILLAVGDAGFQKKCLSVMEDLRRGGRTVLFVSHNMAAVENLCSRGIWIDSGRVWRDGPTHQVIGEYLSTFVEAQETAPDLSGNEPRQEHGEDRYTGLI